MKNKPESEPNEELPKEISSQNSFRSPNSDVEIPKARNRRSKLGNDSVDSLVDKLDPSAVTKQNMSTSRIPAGKCRVFNIQIPSFYYFFT